MAFVNKLVAVLPCKNGDYLEIYKDDWPTSPVSYYLDSKQLGDCQNISEHEARTIMHEEGFLFCDFAEIPDAPTTASGEIDAR
jgi:hypothetical protein